MFVGDGERHDPNLVALGLGHNRVGLFNLCVNGLGPGQSAKPENDPE